VWVGASKYFYCSLSFLFLWGCSSGYSGRDIGLDPEPMAAEGFDLIASQKYYAKDAGVLRFFDNSDLGVAVTRIRWRQASGPSNPGADCEFHRKRLGPPTNLFQCEIKGPARAVVKLELLEDFSESGRQLKKVGMQVNDALAYTRWDLELRSNGYQLRRRISNGSVELLSPDGGTVALLRRDTKSLQTLLILSPRN